MKGGLCLVYTSLLTISVISSCALLILVVADVLQDEGEVSNHADLSGLRNVSQKVGVTSNDVQSQKNDDQENVPDVEHSALQDQEMTFTETLSLNSVTTDGLPDAGTPPILVSLADSNAKLDLKNPEDLLFVNDSEQHNDTKTYAVVEGSDTDQAETKGEQKIEADKETAEPHLVVKAKPMHEVRQTEDAFQSTPPPNEPETEFQAEEQIEEDKPNIPVKPDTPQEDIPSFSEWAQKQLAEAEKKDTVLNHSSQPSHSNTNFSSKSAKVRSKNYASPACGAKVIGVNPEAGSASSILSPNRDEYMLNTCNSRIWFVVELCEAVQAQKIEFANFELFSSTPRDFAVYFSDRYPTRDWASVGQFTAKDMRDVQSFDLFPHLFGKFIKVELMSHHGSEHYCPISLFKVYGTSEFEVLEKENSQHALHTDDEEDDIVDVPDVPTVDVEPSKNLFGSARDAVMSIMKKAAQALGKGEVPKNVSGKNNDTSTDIMYKRCCSPSHIIVCDNCSETLYNEVYELISCSADKLTDLVRQVFLRESLKSTALCQQFGLDFKSTKTIEFSNERETYINAFLPPKYIAALCNIIAIKEKKVVLNTSFETEHNVTSNLTVEETPQTINGETSNDQNLSSFSNACSENNKIEETLPEDSVEMTDNTKIVIELLEEEKDRTEDKTDDISDEKMIQEGSEDPNKGATESETVPEAKFDAVNENKDIPKSDNKNGKTETLPEKPKENGNNFVEDVNDQVGIDGDNFISELDQMAVDPTPAGMALQNQNQAQMIQKESVFLRLSNRVKALERNMSLSGQYLEELSRRYKKQVEEMQKSFEKTILQMTEERRKSNEREQKYLEQMLNIQEQLAQVTAALNILMEDRENWFGNMTFFRFVIYQSIFITVVAYFLKRQRPESTTALMPKKIKKKQDKVRRKSVEGVSGHETPSAKKRRPSEEALQIARHSAEENIDINEGEWVVARKNRRRKTSILHRNLEIEYKSKLIREDSIGQLQENPIPLDEEEFLAPVSEPTEFNENVPSLPTKKELFKTNGSIFNNLKNKTIKTRRLSSPAFLRTLSRQSSRSSPAVKNVDPIYNGKVNRKAASESPTSSLWSESTELSQSLQDSESSTGKKKKSLKNIFRKVF